MIKRRIKTVFTPVFNNKGNHYKTRNTTSTNRVDRNSDTRERFGERRKKSSLFDHIINYIKFVFYCFLLVMPVYAIAVSAIKHDWLMVAIDALLVPVGFVHGLLLIFGFVS